MNDLINNNARPAAAWIGLLALATGLLLPATSRAGLLNINVKGQEKDQWCWDGTCQATLEFYGIKKTQTEIAAYGTWGTNTWNFTYGNAFPYLPDQINRRGCDTILNYFAAITSSGYGNDAGMAQSLATIQSEIDAGRPLPIRWGWNPLPNNGGHILLVCGYSGNNVFLMNPLPVGVGSLAAYDYNWVVCDGSANGTHTWTHGLMLTTSSLTVSNVPRWWLGNYGLTNWSTDALADPDNDKIPTYMEYIAGTDPTNPNSLFTQAITPSTNQPDQFVISWLAASNRLYTLQTNSNLSQTANWASVPGYTNATGTGSTMSYTNTSSGSVDFFRIKVSIKP